MYPTYSKAIFNIPYVCVQGGTYRSPAEGLMTKSDLQQLIKEQLQAELNSYVKVKTIETRTEPNETILYYVSGVMQLTYLFFY